MESNHKIKLSEKNYSCGYSLILAGTVLLMTGLLLIITKSYVNFCHNELEKVDIKVSC